MYVVIAGCGRVGARLATDLAAQGHNVVVVELHPPAFQQLGSAFNGLKIQGNALDEDVLRNAGIERADAFAGVTSRDNVNLMAALIARDIFHVPRVGVRVTDPPHRAVAQEFGLASICGTDLTADQMRLMLLTDGIQPRGFIGNGDLVELSIPAGHRWEGLSVEELERSMNLRVAAVIRKDRGVLPTAGFRIEAGDLLIVATLTELLDTLRGQVASPRKVRVL